jgi:hypothetical protein
MVSVIRRCGASSLRLRLGSRTLEQPLNAICDAISVVYVTSLQLDLFTPVRDCAVGVVA